MINLSMQVLHSLKTMNADCPLIGTTIRTTHWYNYIHRHNHMNIFEAIANHQFKQVLLSLVLLLLADN